MKRYAILAIAMLMAAHGSAGAGGVGCDISPLRALHKSEAVFAAYTTQVCKRLEAGPRVPAEYWTFDVRAVWSGEVVEVVEARFGGANVLQLGKLYLVYVDRVGEELVTGCRTYLLRDVLIDRYYLPAPIWSSPGFESAPVSLEELIELVIDGTRDVELLVDFKWLAEDSETIVPRFRSVIRYESPGDIYSCVRALASMGSAARDAIPDLEKLAQEDDPRQRRAVMWALERIDKDKL